MMGLRAIWVYPLKSGGGVTVDTWELDSCGLVDDRRFMLVDRVGRFVSQRGLPSMAQLLPEFRGDTIQFSFGGGEAIEVDRHPRWTQTRSVEVWGDKVLARRAPAQVSHWFCKVLGRDELELVWFDPAEKRQVDPRYAQPEDRVGFADGFPLLLTNQASLEDLNRRLDAPTTMERFRPNLVVDGGVPFAEDDWKRVGLGGLTFRVAKPCARCQIPNVDQVTGEMGKEPMRTLATFRRFNGEIIFGQNLIHDDVGRLTVGDALAIY